LLVQDSLYVAKQEAGGVRSRYVSKYRQRWPNGTEPYDVGRPQNDCRQN
jgi:hypothetical protein